MNLNKMYWKPELSIGNVDIDKEHQVLLEVNNDLIDLLETKGNREEFARILTKMTDYTLKHFKNEETYMQEFNYPKFNRHRKCHCDYIYEVSMFNVNLSDDNPTDPVIIIEFLKKWWINHILVNDMDYERYKKKINSTVSYKTF